MLTWTEQPVRLLYEVNPDPEKQRPDVVVLANDHRDESYKVLNAVVNNFGVKRLFTEYLPYGKEAPAKEHGSTAYLDQKVRVFGWDDPVSDVMTNYYHGYLHDLFEKLHRPKTEEEYEYAWEIFNLYLQELNIRFKKKRFSPPPQERGETTREMQQHYKGLADIKKALALYRRENHLRHYPARTESLIKTVSRLQPGDALQCGARHLFWWKDPSAIQDDKKWVQEVQEAFRATGLWCAVITTEKQAERLTLEQSPGKAVARIDGGGLPVPNIFNMDFYLSLAQNLLGVVKTG